MMIGSLLIKMIWVAGAKGKEGFIFESLVLFSFLPKPHPKKKFKNPKPKQKNYCGRESRVG